MEGLLKRQIFTIFPALLLLYALIACPGAHGHDRMPGKKISREHKIIVLDPGHGGADHGARGPSGATEKSVTLAMARILEKKLSPEYEVVLTRTGDYEVDIMERASIANAAVGDLFISIHTEGGMLKPSGIELFFYKKDPAAPFFSGSPDYGPESRVGMIRWDDVYLRHDMASRALAGVIYERFADAVDDISAPAGVPVLLLSGLDMPAVCIEAGCLTHPSGEEKLLSKAYAEEFAEKTAEAVKLFFEKK